jgi:hypothetical protein
VKVVRLAVVLAVLSAALAADAGHEITFYPSYYPQEITVRRADPVSAAILLREKKIHAYAGSLLPHENAPQHVRFTESLAGYEVLIFSKTSRAFATPEARCAGGAAVARALEGRAPFVVHPYPVTPYHEDYVFHHDLAQAARNRPTGRMPRVRATGTLGEALTAAGVARGGADADASIHAVGLSSLLARENTSMLGWIGPPWLKNGWFHAWLLPPLQRSLADMPRGRQGTRSPVAQDAFRQRTEGSWHTPVERVNLERRLVTEATAGCEVFVLGYFSRREPVNEDYSEGIENVATDSQAGLGSEIFIRTAKLKDFPWNGWLHVAAPGGGLSDWNPVLGFSGAVASMIWAAIGDPALLLDPDSGRFVPNRARPLSVMPATEAPVDALAPGTLKPLGTATPAGSKVLYRVLLSKTHDGQPMTTADVLYPYVFAERWSTRAAGGRRYDPAIERATALARRSVVAVRVVMVRKEVKELGDMTLMYDVPEIEVYLRSGVDARDAAAIAPPWSPIPWQVLALMEEAVVRGVGAFSVDEAERRRVRLLDVMSHRAALAKLARELERVDFVPEALRGMVSATEARQRWAALREFERTHRHHLPTAGPYVLGRVTKEQVTLPVFRDFSYPLGVGSFDQYPIRLRAFVTRADRRGERVEITAEVEGIEKFARSYKIVREPFRPEPASEKTREPLTVHWMVVGPGEEVAAAGTSRAVQNGRLVVDPGRLRPGEYRMVLALALNGNLVNPEVKVLPYRVGD